MSSLIRIGFLLFSLCTFILLAQQEINIPRKWQTVSVSDTSRSHAIQENGTLWAWGSNHGGKLGDGTTEDRLTPIQISNKKWQMVYVGSYASIGIQEDGTLWQWGFQQPLSQKGNKKWRWKMFIGLIGIQQDGTLWGWVNKSDGKIYDGKIINPFMNESRILGQISNKKWLVVASSDREGRYLSIRQDNTLWGWGYNEYGWLGDGTTENRWSLVQLGKNKWKMISVRGWHNLGIQEDGTLWGWGGNHMGQLGDGTTENRLSPVQIGNKKWRSISIGFQANSLGIQEDGTLWGWGYSGYVPIVDGTTDYKLIPTQISDKKWKMVSAGYWHNFAIQENGTLWAWGGNRVGQLANGTIGGTELSPIPTGFKKCTIDNKSIAVNLLTHLNKGWHLIGSSYEITDFCIFHHIDYVYTLNWNGSSFSHTKRTIDKGDNNITLPPIPAKSGFWVYNATDDNIDINYTKEILPKDKQEHITKAYLDTLPKGWHMIGTSYQINSSKALFNKENGIKKVLLFTEGQYRDITDKETTIPPYSGISLFKE